MRRVGSWSLTVSCLLATHLRPQKGTLWFPFSFSFSFPFPFPFPFPFGKRAALFMSHYATQSERESETSKVKV